MEAEIEVTHLPAKDEAMEEKVEGQLKGEEASRKVACWCSRAGLVRPCRAQGQDRPLTVYVYYQHFVHISGASYTVASCLVAHYVFHQAQVLLQQGTASTLVG